MIKPRTLGEMVELLEAGRINEIDPKWLEETYLASLQILSLYVVEPKENTDMVELWKRLKEMGK